jgi:hypothetical protein
MKIEWEKRVKHEEKEEERRSNRKKDKRSRRGGVTGKRIKESNNCKLSVTCWEQQQQFRSAAVRTANSAVTVTVTD